MQNSHDADGDVLAPTNPLAEQSLSVDLARAEIDQMIATAHRYPRSLDTVIKHIKTMACYNEAAAENCIYSLPRGGKPIIGPSIGFANIVATAWGNCVDGSRWVATDRKEKVVVAEGVFHDYQTNRKTIISEQRRIVDKNGRLYSDDMIIVTSKAAGAIARRNAILQIVPRALWFPIYEEALTIVRGTTETFAEKKDKAIRAFAQFGVKPEQLFMFLGLKGDPDLTLEHIPILRGAYTQLRDQAVTVEEMFDPRNLTGKGFETVANPLADEDEEDDEGPQQQPARQAAPARQDNQPVQQRAPASAQPVGALSPDDDDHDADTGEIAGATSHDVPFEVDDHDMAKARAIGEARQAEQASQAAQKGSKARSKGKGTKTPAAEEAAQTAAPAPAKEVEQPKDPRTTEEYKTYWRGIMAAATNGTALEERWKMPRERTLRGNCSVIEDDLVQLKNETTARVADLKGGGA